MHIGKSYNLSEFLRWTRRSIFWHVLMATVPTILYQVFAIRWLTIPWPIAVYELLQSLNSQFQKAAWGMILPVRRVSY
jgi:hypothetical protein